ncbi:MAG TPA: bifunctional DNA-formamidopyrimidine glycosylase/DNA-(apurinic or apyrimidinic site) lyase [Candidatus Limnocylindria bacterium]
MPELPEVETVARRLQSRLPGATIAGAVVLWPRTIVYPQPPERFEAEIAGANVDRVGRRAKSVVVYLADGRVLTVALRMTGALIVSGPGTAADPYARVVFDLADGRQLRFRDARKFGRIGLYPGRGRRRVADVFSRHGPEPLAPSFTAARLAQRLRKRTGRLKSLLLDQSFIAGVGNIYADEALWRARLHPLRRADTLTEAEIRRLHRAIRAALREGLAGGGATYRDFVDPDGEPGLAAERMRVYQRTGEPCFRCGRPIERIVVGQRATHFCPRCQPAPEAAS